MTTKITLIGASSASQWKILPWQKIQKDVKRLQMRIAKATREGRYGKVASLQRLLTRSFYGKCIAVRRVVTNKGSKTPGIDKVLWVTPAQRMKAIMTLTCRAYTPQPLRRIMIPKKNSTTKMRPLSIPVMADRAIQSLWQLALEPIAEEWADKNSYGFRPKRSCQDAIGQCFILLSRKVSPVWIYEGDIRACFDSICHEWLVNNIPMDKKILRKFLKAEFMENGNLFPTESGVPQGGSVSPIIALMALSGLEKRLNKAFGEGTKVHFVSYADDFIVTGATKEALEEKVIPMIQAFFLERGLELSQEKSKITHIQDGFDFLGFNVRKYGKTLIIKPSKKSVKGFLVNIRACIKSKYGTKTELLIRTLNPKIIGWANYFRSSCASKTFSYIDTAIYIALERWMSRRHANKKRTWIVKNYFRTNGACHWQFHAKVKTKKGIKPLDLTFMRSIHIKRHIKIVGVAHPYNPCFKDYFLKRDRQSNNQRIKEGKVTALQNKEIRTTPKCSLTKA